MMLSKDYDVTQKRAEFHAQLLKRERRKSRSLNIEEEVRSGAKIVRFYLAKVKEWKIEIEIKPVYVVLRSGIKALLPGSKLDCSRLCIRWV